MELPDEEATRGLGRVLAEALRAGDVVVLEGDLGAGKTFLVRAIARGLGVPLDVPVTSPTFTLVHELPGRVPILHADLYRLEDADEIVELGLLEWVGRDALLLVEWGEKFSEALRPDVVIRLALTGETSRSAEIEGITDRGTQIVRAIGE